MSQGFFNFSTPNYALLESYRPAYYLFLSSLSLASEKLKKRERDEKYLNLYPFISSVLWDPVIVPELYSLV